MYDVIIVGAGPAGIFTAYKLITENPKLKLLVIDKGSSIDDRHCPLREGKVDRCINCSVCSIMSGFGGAGTFSDCKLSLTPYVGGNILEYMNELTANNLEHTVSDIIDNFDEDRDKRKIVGETVSSNYKSIESSLRLNNLNLTYCPTKHLGTDGTYKVMKNMYKYLSDKGVPFEFNSEFESFSKSNLDSETCYNVFTTNSNYYFITKYLVFAVGRSGNRYLMNYLSKLENINIKHRPIDIGIRLETPSANVKFLTDELYDMKINSNIDGFKVRTFCTNPNGFVSEENYNGLHVVNGHSYSSIKSDMTNFAVLVTIMDDSYNSDYVMKFLNFISGNSNKELIYDNTLNFISSYDVLYLDSYSDMRTLKNAEKRDINMYYPFKISNCIKTFLDRFDNFLKNFNKNCSIFDGYSYIYGPEVKFYSDTVEVNDNFETSISNIYTIGDGAGITRGIMQAASTGLVVANDILKKESYSK